MKKYMVTLAKYEYYYVDANSVDEAIDMACDLCDADANAWTNPVDEVMTEEV